MSSAGHLFAVVEFAHDQLGAFALDAELRAVRLADADMLDQPQHGDVPGDSFAYVRHREDWDDERPRR